MIHLDSKWCSHCGVGHPATERYWYTGPSQVLCRVYQKDRTRKWRQENRARHLKINNAWRKANPDKVRAQRKRYYDKNYSINMEYTLKKRLRTRLRSALKRNQKTGSAVRDLGCSIPELLVYLESKFQPGMNWDNYGKWHIDHIMPLTSFDLTDSEQVKQACHYTNLQPLWAVENLKKSGRLS